MSKTKAPASKASTSKAEPTKKRPKNKMGWTHATFKDWPNERRDELRTKSQCVAMARILKLERKIANEMNSLPVEERQAKRDQKMVEQYKAEQAVLKSKRDSQPKGRPNNDGRKPKGKKS